MLTLPIPGEHYRLSNICTDAGLNQTERSHPILCAKEKTDNVVMITQSYQNDVETFRDYTKHLRKWLDGDMDGPLFDDQFDGMIRIHGSSGSPEIKGSFAPSPLTDSKDDPQLVLPLHQSLNNHIE